jgi:poly(3-hydroxybutyrate) depolymerase/predicted small lipoprotein YifL
MKRALALFMVLTMVMCAVAACGGAGNTPTTAPDAGTSVSTTVSSTTVTTVQTTATTKKPTTPAGLTVAEQDVNSPSETAGKAPILWLDFETHNIENGIIKNVAGEGLDATIVGTVENITSPTGANAVFFGNSSSLGFKNNSGYLQIKNADKLNFTLDEEFTIDFMYLLDRSASGWDCIFSKGSRNNGWYGVWLGQNDNSNQGVCWGGDTGNNKIGSIYSKYQWHRITVIQKNRTLYTYLDGKAVGAFAAKEYTSATDFYIGGGSHSDGVAQFQGAIDEFKVYDYAFEAKDSVKSIHAAGYYTYEYVSADGTQKMTLPYRVYLPTDFNENTNKYPVLYFLHGHGEVGTDNAKQLRVTTVANLFLDEIAEMDNCIIVAPQTVCDGATNKYEWVASGSGMSGIHQWDGAAGGLGIRQGELSEITHTIGMQAAEALIKEFVADEKNRVDLNRVYVGGISMGGCATWEIMARNPELFAAAVPLCGSGILSTAASLKDIDIWAFHGSADGTVKTEGTRKMYEAIQAAGGTKMIYTELAGQGHSIWNPSYTYKNANGETPAQWLLKQTKAD